LTIELGIFPHLKRGFYCDDKSISHKFIGDTISTGLILSSITLAYPIMWLCEAIIFKPVSLKSSRFKESAGNAWIYFKDFLFGMLMHIFIVDACKVIFGELRPHFLDVCRPDALETCVPGQYVTNYECTNRINNFWFVRDASKSFPSGHASISFFEALFLIWYLQARISVIRSKLLIPTLQCFLLLWAVLCSVSRITDHRHHWWDVLVGASFGLLACWLTIKYLCNKFERKRVSEVVHQNGNADRHTSVRRLLSERTKDEVTLNHVVVP
jgi:phosphatidate phosphatase